MLSHRGPATCPIRAMEDNADLHNTTTEQEHATIRSPKRLKVSTDDTGQQLSHEGHPSASISPGTAEPQQKHTPPARHCLGLQSTPSRSFPAARVAAEPPSQQSTRVPGVQQQQHHDAADIVPTAKPSRAATEHTIQHPHVAKLTHDVSKQRLAEPLTKLKPTAAASSKHAAADAAAGRTATAAGQAGALSHSKAASRAVQPSQLNGPLAGARVYLHSSIPLLQRRLKIIRQRFEQLGASIVSSPTDPGLTHIILQAPPEGSDWFAAVGTTGSATSSSRPPKTAGTAVTKGPVTLPALLQATHQLQQHQRKRRQQQHNSGPGAVVQLLSDAWLDAVLAAGQYVPEGQYVLKYLSPDDDSENSGRRMGGSWEQRQRQLMGVALRPPGQIGLVEIPVLEPAPNAPMRSFAAWLGRWEPSFNDITTQVELVLQGNFSAEASAQRGSNEVTRGLLKELAGYEEALGGNRGDPGMSNINHEALNYAHAAAVVRGCSFPLTPDLSANQLQRLLPFVGSFTANIIHQLIATGICDPLIAFRQDLPARNARGDLRCGTEGAATRAMFAKLPGVGPGLAERWFKMGFRSFDALEDVAAATVNNNEPKSTHALETNVSSTTVRGIRSTNDSSTAVPMSREAAYSLRYRQDLLEAVAPEDVQEMKQEVLAALRVVTGVQDGWQILLVGGGRRSQTVHDADWLITHPDGRLICGLWEKVYRHLVLAGKLVPQEEGFCRIQADNLAGYKAKARRDILSNRWIDRHQMDHYDHIWGIWITAAGKRRRCDLMFIPPDQWVFAVIGWTGSKQYLRFMRQHAGNCGMFLNSHFLMREVEVIHAVGSCNGAAPAASGNSGSSSSSSGTKMRRLDGSSQFPSITAAAGAGDKGAAAAATAVQQEDYVAGACAYVVAAASSGVSRVVLSVPDEVPPVTRHGKCWWPPGWDPDDPAAVGAADANKIELSGSETAAAIADIENVSRPNVTVGVGSGAVSSSIAGTAVTRIDSFRFVDSRTKLSRLVRARPGSNRPVVRESDLFELLGIPYRTPSERNC